MKITKTAIKELSKKYRAILIKCAMLNAVAFGLLYSSNALAETTSSPIVINITDGSTTYNNGENTYSHQNWIGVYTYDLTSGDKENKILGNDVSIIKTNGLSINNVYGIFSTGIGFHVEATSLLEGIDISSILNAGGIILESSGGNASSIKRLGNIIVKSINTPVEYLSQYEAIGIAVSNSGNNEITFENKNSITVESQTGNAYGINLNNGGKATVSNLGSISAKTYSEGSIAYGIFNDNSTLEVSFNGNGGQAISAINTANSGNAFSIYSTSVGAITTVNFTNTILSGKIYNNASLNLNFSNGATWKLKEYDIEGIINNVVLNGSTLDLRDRRAVKILPSYIEKLTLKSGSKSLLYVDVNLATQEIDRFDDAITISENGSLNIVGLNLISEASQDETTITFSNNQSLLAYTDYTGPSSYNLGGFTYTVLYDKTTGQFTFLKQELLQNDIEEEIVKGVFSGVNNALNSTNTAVNTSLRGRFANLGNSSTPSSNNSNVKKGQSGGDEDSKLGLWAQAIYSKVDREKSSASVGFKGHSEGVLIGADTEVTDNVIAGLAYAYTKSNMKSSGSKTNIDTHAFYAYGQYKPNEMFINGSLGYGFSKADPKGSDKDIKSNFYSMDALAGYEMSSKVGKLIPAAGLRYVRVEQKSYHEDDTKIKSKDSNTLTAVVQLGWNDTYNVNGKEVKPKASLGFIYDVKSDNNKVVISSANTKLMSEDGRLKRFGTELSLGADAKLTNNWNVSLDYNGEYRQHYQNHTGTVSVRYDF
ncbi:MAG: autotransporter outer membrane beta-barrel domain-containing protein [Alphaproteobacteria bacterium]|nr:autotransporter outer membrane beta-barrel domain-containing protein [Alphaproteobacteria bacterium]